MAGNAGNKRFIKSGEEEEEEEEDRISSLPDFLVHHILSFLPAADLPKTTVLSKWWNYQWTHVPVLNFVLNAGMSPKIFSSLIDKTLILHDCSNLQKFKIKVKYDPNFYQRVPNLWLWIRFAVRKAVKELILDVNDGEIGYLLLPKFLFINSSLVKLKLNGFYFMTFGEINWRSVKSLRLCSCQVDNGAVEKALSATPLLEHFELCNCEFYCDTLEKDLVIASKRLKTLILDHLGFICTGIEISCPNLERLRVSGRMRITSLKLMNLSSSVYATLDFYCKLESEDEFASQNEFQYLSHDDCINLVHQTLRQVQHVQKLEIGPWLMEWRSHLERSTKECFEASR